MKAVIESGGKQFVVQKGDVIYTEMLKATDGEKISFDTVLSIGDAGAMKFGTPTVSGAKVTGKLLKNGKGKKLTIFTYKSKKGSARKLGHRQPYSKVEITEVSI